MPYSIFQIYHFSNSFMSYRQYNPVVYLNYLCYLHFMQYVIFGIFYSLNCRNPCNSVIPVLLIIRIVPNFTVSCRFVYSCFLDRLDPTKRLLRSFHIHMKASWSFQMCLTYFWECLRCAWYIQDSSNGL